MNKVIINSMNQLQKILKPGNDLIDALSTEETLMKLLFLSPSIQTFLLQHPSLMDVFFTVGVFLIFWRKSSITITEKLLGLIKNSLDGAQIDKLAKSNNFRIMFPQIFEALIKEVSEEKKDLIYKFTKNFINDPDNNSKYLTKAMFTLMQITPEANNVLSIFDGQIQKEWELQDKKAYDKAMKGVWSVGITELNYVLKGKYPNEKLMFIIDELFTYGLAGRGRIMYSGSSDLGKLTEFGDYFRKMLTK